MKKLCLATLALLIYFLASCSEKPDDSTDLKEKTDSKEKVESTDSKEKVDPTNSKEKIDPRFLDMLNVGIGKYRKIVSSLKNSGLSAKELRDLANDADFSLRDLDTFLEAKKASLEAIGISDLGELADEWQDLLNQYNADFLGPYALELFGPGSSVYVQKKVFPVNAPTEYTQSKNPKMNLIYFSQLLKRFPSLSDKFYFRKSQEGGSYSEVRVSPEAIKFAAEYDLFFLSTDQFLKSMEAIPDSGYRKGSAYWSIMFDGKIVQNLLIDDLSRRLEKINLTVKAEM